MILYYDNERIRLKKKSSTRTTTLELITSMSLIELINYSSELTDNEKKKIDLHREKINKHKKDITNIVHKSAWRKLGKMQKDDGKNIDFNVFLYEFMRHEDKKYQRKFKGIPQAKLTK